MRLFTSTKYLFPVIIDGKVRVQSIGFGDYIYIDKCKYVDKDKDIVYFVTINGISPQVKDHDGAVV